MLNRVSLTLNMYLASLECTSPTFGTSMINVVASLTFVIAVALRWGFTLREHVSLRLMRKWRLHEHHLISILCRLEALDVRNARGIAKVVGTLISLAGVMTMTLYKGPEVQSWKGAPIHLNRSNSVHENWVKGPILAGASCISWSLWRRYITLRTKKPSLLNVASCAIYVPLLNSTVMRK